MDIREAMAAQDELNMLNGVGKHANPGNLCWGDGYFARSLQTKYGCSLEALQEKVDKIIMAHKPAKRIKPVKQAFKGNTPLTAGGTPIVPVKPGHDPVSMRADIALLIRQLRTIEHAQDRDLIEAIAKKYGIKPL